MKDPKADYQKLTIEELTKKYKSACREWVTLQDEISEMRSVLFSKQEIASAEKHVAKVRGKHASNAGKGGF